MVADAKDLLRTMIEQPAAPTAPERNKDKRRVGTTTPMAHPPDLQWHRVREGHKTVHKWVRRYARAKPRPHPRSVAMGDTMDRRAPKQGRTSGAVASAEDYCPPESTGFLHPHGTGTRSPDTESRTCTPPLSPDTHKWAATSSMPESTGQYDDTMRAATTPLG